MEETLNMPSSIRTVSGLYVNIKDPDPSTIRIEDIAHSLANQPRFGGHLPLSERGFAYSVAQHCIECFLMAPVDYEFEALMHDASEAYLLDMPKPYKAQLPDYNALEDKIMKVIADKFGFLYPKSDIVKGIDDYMLAREWYMLMLKHENHTNFDPIQVMSPIEAKERFLELYDCAKRF